MSRTTGKQQLLDSKDELCMSHMCTFENIPNSTIVRVLGVIVGVYVPSDEKLLEMHAKKSTTHFNAGCIFD